jgi:hypothetical protein
MAKGNPKSQVLFRQKTDEYNRDSKAQFKRLENMSIL